MNDGTLPGCIGYHGHPISQNGPCDKCRHEKLCQRVVAKKRLKPLVDKILEMEATLKGEEVNQG